MMASDNAPPERFALIIGAMKAGTTSLHDHLAGHPEIARARVKEPDFFSSRWARGRDWYEALWPGFDPARHRWALEASTSYSKHPRSSGAPRRIAGFGGRFKLLYILRDPVDRIESQIAHNIAKGRVPPARHDAMVGAMVERALAVSRYAAQLARFRAAMGAPEILLLDFDDLRRDPGGLLRRCARFLGIDEGFAFPPRPPANVRRARHGSEAFRLGAAERARLTRALEDDLLRLRDEWGFDGTKWLDPGARHRRRAGTTIREAGRDPAGWDPAG